MTRASPKSDAIAGDLHELLSAKLPICCGAGGNLSVAALSERLNMSPEGVYRWLRADEISKRGRTLLIELGNTADNLKLLPEGAVAICEDDLRPFL